MQNGAPRYFEKGLHDSRGLIVTGTHAKCGKTVAAAGLAGVLNSLGFKVQAIKPLSFLPEVSIRKGVEQHFFDRLIRPLQPVDLFSVESADAVNTMEWQRMVEQCLRRVYPYLLEVPGSLASPLRFVKGEAQDCVALAQQLEVPILLVTAKSPEIINDMAQAFAYVRARQAPLIGWLAVETRAESLPCWQQDLLYLHHHYPFPYLGELAYSPSISVEAQQQGNLFRNTEIGLDLLPLQQALDISIPF